MGTITTTNGDVWALDNEKDQIVYLPKGDASKGRILGRTVNGKPVDGTLRVKGPFHLAVDQQDRIWITNGGSDTVTRFPASDPGNAEEIKVGFGPRAVAIDSLGNAWVCNTIGHPGTKEKLDFIMEKLKSKVESIGGSAPKADSAAKMWHDLYELWVANSIGRSVTVLCGGRPETCPPGFKTGDPISPPGGYIGGLQIITDVDIDHPGCENIR